MTKLDDQAISFATRTRLEPADLAPFFAALDSPPQPTERLRKAAERYRARFSQS